MTQISDFNKSVQLFSEKIPETRREQLGAIESLHQFIPATGRLTLDDRRTIVEQALLLLKELYVHLPLKKAMHVVDPVQKLRIIQNRLDEIEEQNHEMSSEFDFHKELLDIFISLRDLHTNYVLPKPFSDYVAILPFLIESYKEDNKRKFVVTKVNENILPETFRPGVEITYWNGVPMQRAVEINAYKNAGSNPHANFARGLENMTIRPMATSLPPDEEWVVIGYKTEDGRNLEHRQEWLVVSPDPESRSINANSAESEESYTIGMDFTTDLTRQIKKILFAPKAVIDNELRLAKTRSIDSLIKSAEGLQSIMPNVFKAKKISDDIGYIRIFTFNVNSDQGFVNEFLRLIRNLPQNGLIIDVRGNGGGLITAAERILQLLTPNKIIPESFQFISSPITLNMARKISFLHDWKQSLSESIVTGSIFSRGVQITSTEKANDLGQQYHGPVILVTDALCYSATDLFAAGFQDHKIGPILGVDGNTGAGGANVWTHKLLEQILAETKYKLKPLPAGSSMRVSIRRNVRVGENAGTPIEDLGIVPDIKYNMTRRDLLEENIDLINKASEILRSL
jgi:hypothetical protein